MDREGTGTGSESGLPGGIGRGSEGTGEVASVFHVTGAR